MINLKTRVDKTGLRLRQRKLRTGSDELIQKYVKQLSEEAAVYARVKAPKLTGDTAGFIVSYQEKLGYAHWKGIVEAKNSTAGGTNRLWPQNTGKYGNISGDFNLTKWMHLTGGVFRSWNPFGKKGTRHITSGDPKFMYSAEKYGLSRARAVLKKINKNL